MEDGAPLKSASMEALDWQMYRTLSLQPHGFGNERVRIWPRLVHLQDCLSEDQLEHTLSSAQSDEILDQEYAELQDGLGGRPHSDEHQIELDTDRSFVLYPGGGSREKRQAALNHLIVSLFRKRPRLHYFQGYHDIVSVVFLTLPKELHLPVTEKLSLHRVRDSMGPNLDPVVGLLRVLKKLLRLVDHQFAESLERTAPLPYYALSNLLTLFSHDVPTLPLIQHIFDYLLARPPIAVVYLAAALILTRKEEVQLLEDEGEEGMMHSLLTVLPDLYEEGDEAVSKQPERPNDVSEAPEAKFKAEEPEAGVPMHPAPPATESVEEQRSAGDGSEDRPSTSQAQTDDAPAISAPAPIPEGAQSDGVVDPTRPSPSNEPSSSAPPSSPDDHLGAGTRASPILAPDPDLPVSASDTLVEPKLEPVEVPPPSSDADEGAETAPLLDEKHSFRTASPEPEPEPRPRRPRVSLTALLTAADALLARFPPTHPGVALAAVLGPQSAMRTWSECAADLPDDDEAEAMVARPELVVLPYVDDDDEGEESEEREKERERRRRKLRKPRRLTDLVLHRRTMVAGAVIVLGVAVAVYGLNTGLPGAGNGHHRHGFGKEWKKLGRFFGGVLMGAGGRVLDGLRHGLE